MTTSVPIILNAGEGDRQAFAGGGVHTWKLLTEETGGALFAFEDVMERGKVTPLHLHPEAAEIAFVLEGEIVELVDGVEHHIRAGGMSYIPKGVPHAFQVVSETARILAFQTPGIGQGFFRGASDPAEGHDAEYLDVGRLQATAAANPSAIQILGPPPFAPC